MKPVNLTALPRLLASATLLLAGASAHAQYMWIDANGHKQLSDQPPPPSTPAKNILKAPSARALSTSAADAADVASGGAPAAEAVPAPAAAPSLADREADYRKRKLAESEQSKKQAEQAKVQARNALACAGAQALKQRMSSGERVAMPNAHGEPEVVTDAMRAQRTAEANQTLAKCKAK